MQNPFIVVLFILLLIVLILCAIKSNTLLNKSEIAGGGPIYDFKHGMRSLGIPSQSTQLKGEGYNLTVDPKLAPKSKKKFLAQKLTEAGWVLYVKDQCPWCHLQIDMFGENKHHLKIINCSHEDLRPKQLKACHDTWVYPTWVKGNQILPGSQTFRSLNKALKTKSGITKEEYKKLKKHLSSSDLELK